MKDPKEHLVLRHKVSQKIASRKDQRMKALSLEAVQLTTSLKGGGIVSLLLPNSMKEKKEIDVLGRIYNPVWVQKRAGEAAKKGKTFVREAVRTVLENDALFCALAIAYEVRLGANPGPQATSAKAIACWLQKELKRKDSPAYQAVKSHGGDILLEIERSDRWWIDAFSDRRKTQS